MSIAYLTSRSGKINQLMVYNYVFKTHNKFEQNRVFEKIKENGANQIYQANHLKFETFSPIFNEFTKEYQLREKLIIEPPFKNIAKISRFISHQINDHLRIKFKQFFHENLFIVDQVIVNPFKILKCVEYNVELFDDGNYFIHFKPVSKILIEEHNIDRLLALRLHLKGNESEKLILTFVKTDFKKVKLNINDDHFHEKVKEIFSLGEPKSVSVDYHLLATYSNEVFREICKNTFKELKPAILFVHRVLKEVTLPESFGLKDELYVKSELLNFGNENNLELGKPIGQDIVLLSKNETQYGLRIEYSFVNTPKEIHAEFMKSSHLREHFLKTEVNSNCKVLVEKREGWTKHHITSVGILSNNASQQSAAFYHGIYQPASNAKILPLLNGISDIELFKELATRHFNKNAENFEVLDSLYLNDGSESIFSEINEIYQHTKDKFLLCIFTKYSLQSDITEELRKLKIPYQIFQGEISVNKGSNPKLSNFTCKCLEKIGGIVASIKDSGVPNDTYFVGIDLGHSKSNEDPKSYLGLSVFNSKGILLAHHREISKHRNEALNNGDLRAGLYVLKKQLEINHIELPNQVVVHRDGKLHTWDKETILDCFKVIWEVWEIDILEIIKMGYPIIATKEENTANNPSTGSAFLDENHKYAILATNTQIDEYGAIIKPIIIKHKFGESDFKDLIKGVYWLTKVYTNNLFNSTRLPATTLKSNNIVSTSDKIHQPTYLG